MEIISIGIFIFGLGLSIFTAFSYFTKEKVVEIGSLTITADKPHHVKWSPVIGVAVMAVGGITYWLSTKK